MISQIPLRWRIAAVALLLTMGLLSAVVWLAQDQLLKSERQDRIATLCLEVRRMALNVRTESPIPTLTQSMVSRLKISSSNEVLIHWENYAKGKVWQTEAWPTTIEKDQLLWKQVPVTPVDEVMTTKGPVTAVACERADFEIESGVREGNWMAARAQTAEGYGFVAVDMKAISDATYLYITKPLLSLVVPVSIVLSLLMAWLLSAFTMRPVDRLARSLVGIAPEKRNKRLSLEGYSSEFKTLVASYNAMLDRLEKNYEQAARFSSDAAHELKTPLTVLQGRIESALNDPKLEVCDQLLLGLQTEVSHLSNITSRLLLLSKVDAGQLVLDRVNIDWTSFVQAHIADLELIKDSNDLRVSVESNLCVQGDEVLLHQLFSNLISNVARYGLAHGWVEVVAKVHEGGVVTIISNQCLPISDDSRARFFDRFYRDTELVKLDQNGSGLGLSLAKEIAEAHGGSLELLPSAEDVVSLKVWLPNC